jgi:hypothetical protein
MHILRYKKPQHVIGQRSGEQSNSHVSRLAGNTDAARSQAVIQSGSRVGAPGKDSFAEFSCLYMHYVESNAVNETASRSLARCNQLSGAWGEVR